MGNTIGKILKLTTFGESHGQAIGGIIEGFPAGIKIDFNLIKTDLQKRSAKSFPYSTPRHEPDNVEFLSGIFENKSLGTPIAFIVYNKNQNPNEYSNLKNIFRASHADYGYYSKYGIRDYRGGGRASARETIARVIGGSFAKMILSLYNIKIFSYIISLCGINIKSIELEHLKQSILNIPDSETEKEILNKLQEIHNKKDSCGGIIETKCFNVPAGLGEPVFDKLEAELAKAILSIPASKGIEFGEGFGFAKMFGSNSYDEFIIKNNKIITKQNYNGGILGGISTGNEINFRTVFKPASTINQPRNTVTIDKKEKKYIPSGRHDTTFLPRACIIVENMTALVLADMILRNQNSKK